MKRISETALGVYNTLNIGKEHAVIDQLEVMEVAASD